MSCELTCVGARDVARHRRTCVSAEYLPFRARSSQSKRCIQESLILLSTISSCLVRTNALTTVLVSHKLKKRAKPHDPRA